MAVSAGKHSRIYVQNDSSPVSFADEATTADSNYDEYTITDRTKKYWPLDANITVYRNGTQVDPSEYRIQYAGGKIHFKEAQASTDTITVDGSYVTTSLAAQANDYDITFNSEVLDVTVFESDGWRDRLASLVDASGSVSGFYDLNNFYQDRILSGDPLILEFFLQGTTEEFFACYAVLDSHEMSTAVEEAVETDVSWASHGAILVES